MKESKPWQIIILIFWRSTSFLLVLLILLALVIAFPNPVLKPLLLSAINSRIEGNLEVQRLYWTRKAITLEGVVFTPPEQLPPLKAKNITVLYTIDKKLTFYAHELITHGVEIPVIQTAAGAFAVQGIPMEASGSASPSTFSFPLPTISMNDTSVNFQTEFGQIDLNVTGLASLGEDKNLTLEGRGELSSPFVKLKGDLSVTGKLPVLNGNFSLNQLIVPQLFSLPIEGKGEFTSSLSEIKLSGQFSNKSIGLSFTTNTQHNIEKNSSHTRVNFKVPNLKATLDASMKKIQGMPEIKGGVFGKANVFSKGNEMTGNAQVSLQNLTVEDEDYSAHNISGTLNFNNLEDFSTPKNQKITLQRLDSFLPLSRVRIAFQHRGNGVIHVESAEAGLGNGLLKTSPFIFESFDRGVSFTLYMNSVSAQFLADFSKLSNLSVTGSVNGEMKLELKDQDFSIQKGGKLWVTAPPGIIKYRPDMSQTLPHNLEALTGNENPMDLALIALWNFHYTDLSMTIDKPLKGELNGTLHLKGNNPDAFSGHPLEFNINVTGETLRLIREALSSMK